MKMKAVLIGACVLFTAGIGAAQIFSPFEYKQEFMDLKTAEKKWGHAIFDEKKFLNGTIQDRASMAVDLISRKKFVGENLTEVQQKLGKNTGHFWSDFIPTFIIEDGASQQKDTWQIVFLPDSSRRVKEVRIHKNCCSAEIWKQHKKILENH